MRCAIKKILAWIGTVFLAALVGFVVALLYLKKKPKPQKVDIGRLKELEKDLDRLREEAREIERRTRWFDSAEDAARYLSDLLERLKGR